MKDSKSGLKHVHYIYEFGGTRFPWPMRPLEALVYVAVLATTAYLSFSLGWRLGELLLPDPHPARLLVWLGTVFACVLAVGLALRSFRPKDLARRYAAVERDKGTIHDLNTPLRKARRD